MSSFRTILVNAFWLVSDRLFRLIANFFIGILIARHLGPQGFGVLNYGQVMLMLLTPLATFGLPELTVRELSRRRAKADAIDVDRITSTVLGVRLGCACAAIVILTVIAFVGRGGNFTASLVILAFGTSLLPQSFDVLESRFQSVDALGLISTGRMVNTVVFAAARLLALYFAASVLAFALISSAEIASFACFTTTVARRRGWRIGPTDFDPAFALRILREALPLMVRLVTIGIYMRIDQVMIQHFMGDTALGVYSASTRISELWYFIPLAIITGAAPTLTRHYDESLQSYERELGRLMRLMVLLSVPLAAVLSLGSGPLVHLLFGTRYAAAAPVLAIHAWAGVFVALGVATNPWFINTGNLRYGLYQALSGAVTSVTLNAILIPRFGLIGAAFSLVLSYAVSAIGMNAIFPQTRGLLLMQLRALTLR